MLDLDRRSAEPISYLVGECLKLGRIFHSSQSPVVAEPLVLERDIGGWQEHAQRKIERDVEGLLHRFAAKPLHGVRDHARIEIESDSSGVSALLCSKQISCSPYFEVP